MSQKKESFFWTSYSDLMTSLFFIMLVLFILVIVLLHKRMEVTERQLAEIKKVEQSTQDLDRKYFTYRPDYKKYVLNIAGQYLSEQSNNRLTPFRARALCEYLNRSDCPSIARASSSPAPPTPTRQARFPAHATPDAGR